MHDVAADDERRQPERQPVRRGRDPAASARRTSLTSSSLSAIGSSQAPRLRLLPGPPRDEAVERVGDAGASQTRRAPSRARRRSTSITKAGMSSMRSSVIWLAVVNGHGRHRRSWCRLPGSGLGGAPASASTRTTAATASAPVTICDGWKRVVGARPHHAARRRPSTRPDTRGAPAARSENRDARRLPRCALRRVRRRDRASRRLIASARSVAAHDRARLERVVVERIDDSGAGDGHDPGGRPVVARVGDDDGVAPSRGLDERRRAGRR